MLAYLVDIYPIALVVLFLYKIRPIKCKTEMNLDYLSREATCVYKGLLAVVIVLHHLSQKTLSGVWFREFSKIGYLAAALYFFFSGYGLQKSYLQKGNEYSHRFLLKRIPAVLFPYIIVSVLYWLMYVVSGNVFSVKDLLTDILNGNPMVLYSWYIIVILIFYIVFWVLMLICGEKRLLMILGACIWYVIHVMICRRLGFGSWWYNTSHVILLGMIWGCYEEGIFKVIKKHYWKLLTLSWVVFVTIFWKAGLWIRLLNFRDAELIVAMITATIFVFAALLLVLKLRIGNKISKLLGKISLEIYLTQGLFIICLRNSFIYIQNEFWWIFFVLMGTFVFSCLLNHFLRWILLRYMKLVK